MTVSIATENALQTVADKFAFSVDKFPLYGPDNMATPPVSYTHLTLPTNREV